MARPLHFPSAFRDIRMRRGLLQKAVAVELRVDPAVLCSIEKGTRAPLDDQTLSEAARLFNLSETELDELIDFLKWTSEVDTQNWPPKVSG